MEEEELLRVAADIVRKLIGAGIKLLAIDFDATLLSIHTSGRWEYSAVELCPYVRPLFLALIRVASEAGIHVSVVTFSPQVALIREVLHICFGDAIAEHVIVRADEASWSVAQSDLIDFLPIWHTRSPQPLDRSCKLPYVISAALEASRWSGESILNSNTLLLDDDPQNVRIANDHGIIAIFFDPETATMQTLWSRIQKLQADSNLSLKTPSKPNKRRSFSVMSTPEPSFKNTTTPSKSATTPFNGTTRTDSTPAPPPRKAKGFNLCTPSPVMKLKYTVEMGRPRSKKLTKHMRQCTRNIDGDLEDLHGLPSGSSIMF
ncbi:TPA: hypothetical protein N0F65_006873 [Lagenidium giganteum]|uniref:FCP1 homology domain-containing protein n=1 Tax=Lagenidium giganteum TaxID=4803 RepID=A0AAV2ZBQ1_9STRA|nr:TPA: hypothetical protein N0F65_006873 [Lagenidium giganteum]